MNESLANLDDDARRAVDAALSTAGAFGDIECGTEYLLYGAVATASGEVAELAELFALTSIRLERAIVALRGPYFTNGAEYDGDPQLSAEALAALRTPRRDGDGPTGVFEMLAGLTVNEDSGAGLVLRQLGVLPDDFERLVTYGTWHLSKDEADALLNALDRRAEEHLGWWGPAESSSLVELLDRPLEVAKSRSAVASLTSLSKSDDGVRITLAVSSLESWILDPVLAPLEQLVPSRAATTASGPDLFRLSVVGSDIAVSNDRPHSRWSFDEPGAAVLVPLNHRTEKAVSNDRRSIIETTVTSTWWIWPLPASETFDVRVDWSAEVLHGSRTVKLNQHVADPTSAI